MKTTVEIPDTLYRQIKARAALKEQQRLADEYPNVPQYRSYLGNSHNNLGTVMHRLGKRAEAETG